MSHHEGFRRFFRLAATPRSAEREVDDELRFHLESRVAELVARGRPRQAAEREAAREFGDVGAARAELTAIDVGRLRRAERAEWWGGWAQDVRYAVRALRRAPGFAIAVLLTIALGVGANGAIFSVTDAALLRPLPYHEPDALVHLWTTTPRSLTGKGNSAYPNLLDWRRRSTTLSGIAGYHSNRMVLTQGDEPRVLWAGKTSANFFDVLGVTPAVGRRFAEGEDAVGAARVVMLSHGLWVHEFARDSAVVGRAVSLDGAPYTVIGVLPEAFQFALVGAAEVWVPIDRNAQMRENRSSSWFDVVARLRPGVRIERAQQEMDAIARDLAREHANENTGVGVSLVPLRDELTGPVRPVLVVLFGAVGFVLLVALANVANLLLVRGTARAKELGIRAALGAGQARIVRQLLTEGVLLAALGGALGLVVAHFGVRALVATIPPQRLLTMPYLADVGIDGRLVGYMLALSLAAGLVFGLIPALRVARPGLFETLRQGARGSSAGGAAGRLRDGLVAAELALTVVLVVGAALFGKSLARLLAVDPGFRTDRVFTAYIPLPRADFATNAKRVDFFLRLEDRVRALPAVESVGLTTKLPLDGGNSASFRVVGQPAPEPGQVPSASFRSVTPDYFRTLGIPLVRGAPFDARADTAAPRVVVINEALARKAFPSEDPIGRQIVTLNDAPWTVVGVVGDVAIGKLEDQAPPTIYLPFRQFSDISMRVAVRTRGEVAGLEQSVRRVVRELDPHVALYQVYTMESLVQQSESVFRRRFPLLLVGAFALAALLLAIVGTYGVISYSVAQRLRELGIRIALGATPGSVVGLVVRHAATLALAGIGVGVVTAAVLSRYAASLLYGVRGTDPTTYLTAAAVLGAVAALAAAVPARRATRVDPVVTLRDE
jgi:putative ABC transport system permease protein